MENQQLCRLVDVRQECKEERPVVCYGVEEVESGENELGSVTVTSSLQMLDSLWVLKSCLRICESAAGPALCRTKH